MIRTVHRHTVPVDDRWHRFQLTQSIVHVDTRDPNVVEFWTAHTDDPPVAREFRVFGTGHRIDEDCRHVGSVVCADGALVWHLFERDAK